MSTLQIRKLQSGAFKHVDSIDGDFFLGRFNFKQEFNKAFLVEAYGAKRRQYSITEVEVFDFGGTAEPFTNWTDLINRLVDLGYTGIDTNSIPSGGGVWGSITGNIASQTDLQNELNTKLDKVTTTDVEKVYIKNADGTQGMKPTSELGGGGARTYICEFGINQNIAAIPTGNTQWMHRTAQAGHNVSATWTLDTALDVSTSFANMFILTPCFSLPFQAKIKSVFVRGWHSHFNSTGVDFVVLKSHETGPTINGGMTTVSNPLIVARENVQIWASGAGNGFLKQFDGSSLTTTTLPLGSDIRLVFKNQNTSSFMWDTLVTVEFEEVI